MSKENDRDAINVIVESSETVDRSLLRKIFSNATTNELNLTTEESAMLSRFNEMVKNDSEKGTLNEESGVGVIRVTDTFLKKILSNSNPVSELSSEEQKVVNRWLELANYRL